MFSVYAGANVATKTNGYFVLKSLQPEFLIILQQGFEYYEHCHEVFFDSPFIHPDVRRKQLAHISTMQGSNALRALKALTVEMKQERDVFHTQQWRKSQACSFQEPQFFQQMQASTPFPFSKTQLAVIEQRWQSQGHYAYFGPDALLRVHYSLMAIEQIIRFAITELERRYQRQQGKNLKRNPHPIPKTVYTAYKAYLDDTLNAVVQEQEYIAASMVERLWVVAQHQDITNSDVLMQTLDRLKSIKVLKSSFAMDVNGEGALSSKHFNQFHRIIMERGSAPTKKRLLALPWFSQNTQMTVSANHHVDELNATALKHHLANQFNLGTHIPSQLKKPTWLFKGTAIRYNFFEDPYPWASFTLAQQRYDTAIVSPINPQGLESLCAALAQLSEAFDTLEEKTIQVHRQLRRLSRRFTTGKTQAFIQTYEEELDVKKHIAQTQLDHYLQHLLAALKKGQLTVSPALVNHLALIMALPITQSQTLKTTFDSLEVECERKKAQHRHELEKHEHMVRVKALLNPLQTQTLQSPASDSQMQALMDYYENLPTRSSASNQLVVEYFLMKMEDLMANAKASFVTPPLPEINKPDTAETLKQYYRYLENQGLLLMRFGRLAERQQVSEVLCDITHHYFQHWISCDYSLKTPIDLKQTIAETQEDLLLTLGDKQTQQRIQHCRTLRQQQHFDALASRSQAYLSTIDLAQTSKQLTQQLTHLETQLLHHLSTQPHLAFTPAQCHYVCQLCTRMVKENVTEIQAFKTLTTADKVFLGLHEPTFFENALGHHRKGVQCVINSLVAIRMTKARIPSLTCLEQLHQQINDLKQTLTQHLNRDPEPALQKLIRSASCFEVQALKKIEGNYKEIEKTQNTEEKKTENFTSTSAHSNTQPPMPWVRH